MTQAGLGREWFCRALGALLTITCCVSCGTDSDAAHDVVADLTAADSAGDVPSDAVDVSDLGPSADADSASDIALDQMGLDGLDVEVLTPRVYPNAEVFPQTDGEVELPPGVRVKVITLNVYSAKVASAAAIGAFLAQQNPDLVGLQECNEALGQEIATAAGFQFTYGSGVFMMSKTPLVNMQTVELVEDRRFLRAETVIGGVPVTFYNTHLSWNVAGNLQFRQFVDDYLKKDPTKRIIMTGDFNDEHYSTQNTIMEEWGVDCFTASQVYPGQRISWPSTGFDETEGSQLIDLVWFPKAFPAIVISAAPLNIPGLLSDHKPVVAELLLPSGEAPFVEDPYAAQRNPWRGFPAELPENLLTNPGAEEGLVGWSMEGGATVAEEREHQVPRTGSKMFGGSAEGLPTGSYWSSGSQEVSLAGYGSVIDEGRGVLWVSGYVTTGYQIEERDGEVSNVPKPYDQGELILEYLDGSGVLKGRWSSGPLDTLGWHAAPGVVAVPPGVRNARLLWISHLKQGNGPSNDALFDDLYLGFGAVETPHTVLGPALLADGGAELASLSAEGIGDVAAADGKGVWSVATDLLPMGPWGIYLWAPWSWSGKGFYVATSKVLPAEERTGAWGRLCWNLDLGAYASDVDAGLVDVEASAWLRNYKSFSGASLRLELGTSLGEPLEPQVVAAEWTKATTRQQVPAGVRTGRLCLEATLTEVEDPVFADAVYAVPVRHQP